MIEIDGAQKSGSGTIIRCAVALATLLRQELHIWNIRARRDKPGLRPQHLQAIRACQEISQGEVEGARVGSSEIIYRPGRQIRGGYYEWDIGTAGSATMLTLTVLPLACFASETLSCRISGGLFQDFAPSAYHTKYVLLPILERMGVAAKLQIDRPGYVPEGGGILTVKAGPVKDKIKALNLTQQGEVAKIKGIALSSHLKEARVSDRMAQRCKGLLEAEGYNVAIETQYDTSAIQKGAALGIWTETTSGCLLGSDMAGRPGRSSERIGKHVAENLIQALKTEATVDRFLADQLILYCALAGGVSEYLIPEATEHVETNLWLVQQILSAGVKRKDNRVRIHGIGYHR